MAIASIVAVFLADRALAGRLPCDSITAPPGAVLLYPDAPATASFWSQYFLIDGNDSATLDGTPGPAPAI